MSKRLAEAAHNLCTVLDLPSDSPKSSAARLVAIAKDSEALTELVVAFTACEGLALDAHQAAAAPWRAAHLKTAGEKWQVICAMFPSLTSHALAAEAIAGTKLRDLEQIGRRGDTGNGCKHAIRFVLALWNPGFDWECGRFELVPALRAWDDAHKAAIKAWLDDPWWP